MCYDGDLTESDWCCAGYQQTIVIASRHASARELSSKTEHQPDSKRPY